MSAVSSTSQVSKSYEPQAKKQRSTSSSEHCVNSQRKKIPYAPQKCEKKIKAIKIDDPGIIMGIGKMYRYGFDIEPKLKVAKKLFKESVKMGSIRARFHLAICYTGDKYVKHMRRAAEARDYKAQAELGHLYHEGILVPEDTEQEFLWTSRSADNRSVEDGNIIGHYNLAMCYADGVGCKKDVKRAEAIMLKLGNLDDDEASLWLGKHALRKKELLESASSYSERVAQGKVWIRKAAELGNEEACGLLKLFDLKAAKKIIAHISKCEAPEVTREKRQRESSEYLGKIKWKIPVTRKLKNKKKTKFRTIKNPVILNHIALMYYNGKKTKQNMEMAFKIWKDAARMGNVNAQHNLGMCYQDGAGTEINLEKCIKWVTTAADNGDVEAQLNLARIYRDTIGEKGPNGKVFQWMELAAGSGNSEALYELGLIYEEGIYVMEKDMDEAVKCMEEADEHENNDAKVWLAKYYLGIKDELDYSDAEYAKELIREAANANHEEACELQSLFESPVT